MGLNFKAGREYKNGRRRTRCVIGGVLMETAVILGFVGFCRNSGLLVKWIYGVWLANI